MEQNPHSALSIPDAATMDSPRQPPKPTPRRRHNKLGRPMNIIKVALFMMRRRSSKSNMLSVNEGSKSIWGKLLGSMKPLQSNRSSLGPLQPKPRLPLIMVSPPPENTDRAEDALSSVSESPAVASHYYSPSPLSSRYASALALNELDQPKEDPQKEAIENEEGDDNYKEREEDTTIDAKAEEFIAQYYHYHSPSSPSSRYASAVAMNELDQPEEFIGQLYHHSPSSPSSSRYASALALNELDQPEEEGDDNNKDKEGDAMIDAKAEEFIAQYYYYHSPSSRSSRYASAEALNELDEPEEFIPQFHYHSPSSPSSSRYASTVALNELDEPEEFIPQFYHHSPSSPSSSRYASAVALNELDQPEGKEGDNNYKDTEGDTMIDAKAEEFIAQFYHQMRLQHLDDTDGHQ